ILRTLPLTQETSFANQGVLYQPTIEQTFDYVVMLSQQIEELQGRALTVAVSDDPPDNLPTATERALLYLAFDSSGNPIATAGTTSTNPVSSAMTPVVSAASLSAGRAAFGLGDCAVEDIGGGLQDDGSGNLRVINTVAADSGNKAVTSSFHKNERHA